MDAYLKDKNTSIGKSNISHTNDHTKFNNCGFGARAEKMPLPEVS